MAENSATVEAARRTTTAAVKSLSAWRLLEDRKRKLEVSRGCNELILLDDTTSPTAKAQLVENTHTAESINPKRTKLTVPKKVDNEMIEATATPHRYGTRGAVRGTITLDDVQGRSVPIHDVERVRAIL